MAEPLYSWPGPDGGSDWKLFGEPADAYLEQHVLRNDGEHDVLVPYVHDCFDPLVAEVLRLASEVSRLQSIVDQQIGEATNKAVAGALNRDAGYQSGAAATREKMEVLVEAAYTEGWQTGWSDGIELAAEDDRTVEDRWEASKARLTLRSAEAGS